MNRRVFLAGVVASVVGVAVGVQARIVNRTADLGAEYQSWGQTWTPEGMIEWKGKESFFHPYPQQEQALNKYHSGQPSSRLTADEMGQALRDLRAAHGPFTLRPDEGIGWRAFDAMTPARPSIGPQPIERYGPFHYDKNGQYVDDRALLVPVDEPLQVGWSAYGISREEDEAVFFEPFHDDQIVIETVSTHEMSVTGEMIDT